MSCILQQDDIIRMANLSTTKIRHSFVLGLHAGDFPLKRITSFIISIRKRINNNNKFTNKPEQKGTMNGLSYQRARNVIAI